MIIISGPSTIGKNPFIYKACELYDLKYVVPYTTRSIRDEEANGNDYFFLSKEEFQIKIRNKEMSHWDYCLDNYYGYAFNFPGEDSSITHGLSRMVLRIKAQFPQKVTTIFLMPSNKEKILNNIKQIYTGKALALREALVEEEICHSKLFDNVFTCSNSVFDLLDDSKIKKLLLNQK